MLLFEGLENQSKSKQIANFLSQLAFQTHVDIPARHPTEWREALKYLIPLIEKKRIVILFDEFQWMANYRQEMVSDLKMVWDQYLTRAGVVTLILCGSIASFMIKKVIRSSAFYGRTDFIIDLKPFSLNETKEMFSDRSLEEILEAQMLIGGIPKYLELLREYPSVLLGMQELGFNPHGYFVEEYDRIFTSHFGRNRDYQKIIDALAARPYGLTRLKICQQTGIEPGGGVSNALFNLESAGFIQAYPPYHKERESKLVCYCLKDPYLRFYFTFIKPSLKKIKSQMAPVFYGIMQSATYHSWMGRAFEYLCMDHAKKISALLGFSGIDYTFGPFFKAHEKEKGGTQIDLLFDRADHVISLCEMKYTKTPPGIGLIEETEKKAALLKEVSTKTIQKILITKEPPSQELINRGYFYKIIGADELFLNP
jgi:hypothetical protein